MAMQLTKIKKWWLKPLILLLVVITLHILALQHSFIENVYSAFIYPPLAYVLRLLTGWIPFSVGDMLYTIAFIWLLVKTIQFFKHKPTWIKFGLRTSQSFY